MIFYERQIKPINENYLLNERLALIRKEKTAVLFLFIKYIPTLSKLLIWCFLFQLVSCFTKPAFPLLKIYNCFI